MRKLSSQFNKTETNIADNLLTSVLALQRAGAEKIVVILLPDIGTTPLINSLLQGLQKNSGSITADQLSAEMLVVTNDTNALIRKKLAGTRAVIIDVNGVLQPLTSMATPGHFQETPQQFGKQQDFIIANNKEGACPPKQQALYCVPTVADAQQFVFEDLAHPTDQTHRIVGDYVFYQSQIKFGAH